MDIVNKEKNYNIKMAQLKNKKKKKQIKRKKFKKILKI